MRAAAASASSAGVPASIDARHQSSLLARMKSSASGLVRSGDDLLAGLEVFPEGDECQIPSDADRAGPVLVPLVVVDVRDVLEAERRGVTRGAQVHLDPRHLAAVLPRDREMARRFARGDRAARLAFELIAPTDAEVTRDRQEPPRDAVRVRQGVPHVIDLGVVRAFRDDHAGGLALVGRRHDLSPHGADCCDEVHARDHISECLFDQEGCFSKTTTCFGLSEVNGEPTQSAHRSRTRNPASLPIKSSSAGHTYRYGAA